MSNNTQNTKRLTIRDLITAGIFSAIIFICIMVSGGIFAAVPTLTFYYPVGASLLAGPVYLLMVAKVPKRGPIAIAGILAAVFCFATGMHWAMAVGYIVGGILSDLIAGISGYKSIKTNRISYLVFCLGGTGTYLAYFINPGTWVNTMLNSGTPQDYIDTMQASVSIWVFISMLLGTVIVSLISSYVGSKLLKKQFEKAGITA